MLRNIALIPEGIIQPAFNKIWARIAEMNEPDSFIGVGLWCFYRVKERVIGVDRCRVALSMASWFNSTKGVAYWLG
jgi:hypothetical protein